MDVFRANYPSSNLTDEALQASYQQKLEYIQEREGGRYYDPRFPVDLPLAQERMREEAQE